MSSGVIKIMFSKTSLLGVALVFAAAAQAHHSFAMFDNAKEQTIEGEVKDFQWTNPHIWIHVNVVGADGKVVEYALEGGSPNNLRRAGWTRDSMKPGDKVVVKMHPMKDGSPGGSFVSAVVNGTPLSFRASESAAAADQP